jgi:hypothetical protein
MPQKSSNISDEEPAASIFMEEQEGQKKISTNMGKGEKEMSL